MTTMHKGTLIASGGTGPAGPAGADGTDGADGATGPTGPSGTGVKTIAFTFAGVGGPPTVGSKAQMRIVEDCTIVSATMVADQTGAAVVDVNKSTYANFPTTASIAAAAKPTLAAQKSEDTTLTGWTKALSAGDILEAELDSVTTCTRVQLFLKVTVP